MLMLLLKSIPKKGIMGVFYFSIPVLTVLTCCVLVPLGWPLAFSSGDTGREIPVIRHHFGGSAAAEPINIAGAAGENFFLLFEIIRLEGGNLSISLAPSSSLELKAYLTSPDWQKNVPDVLIPLEQCFPLTQKSLRLVIVLKIPHGHPIGVQNLELVFKGNGQEIRLPLNLRIWRFTLPEDLDVTILGNLWPCRDWFARYGVLGEEAFVDTLAAYLIFLRSYKFNAIGNFYPLDVLSVAHGKSLHDFPSYERLLDLILSLGYRYFRLPTLPHAERLGEKNSTFARYAIPYYSRLAEYLKSRLLLNKAMVKVWDEPEPAHYPLVAQAYGLIKTADAGLLTESAGYAPDPFLTSFINIWAMNSAYFDPNRIETAMRLGQQVWLYANLLHGIDRPAVCQRLVGWYLFKSSCSGYLFWSVNYWLQDPWTNVPGEGEKEGFFRRGTLVYPHPTTGQPLSTLRLESMRRGWEDYQYLILLKKAAAEGKIDKSMYDRIQAKLAKIAQNLKDDNPKVSWQQLEDLRIQIGELLDHAVGGENG